LPAAPAANHHRLVLTLRVKGSLGKKGWAVARGVVALDQLVQDHRAATTWSPWTCITVGLELNGLPAGGCGPASAAGVRMRCCSITARCRGHLESPPAEAACDAKRCDACMSGWQRAAPGDRGGG
jgi:hypothetical protein